jgi:hypothetical protein
MLRFFIAFIMGKAVNKTEASPQGEKGDRDQSEHGYALQKTQSILADILQVACRLT